MPDPLFSTALRRADDGLAGIEHLSNLCRTSLTSTAIRYIEKATIPATIVVSTGTCIDYCFMSAALKDFKGPQWVRKGTPLPPSGLTMAFNADASNVANAARDENTADLRDWFDGERSIEVLEQVIGLGAYGKTLTVITCDTFADEADEDEQIKESWTLRF